MCEQTVWVVYRQDEELTGMNRHMDCMNASFICFCLSSLHVIHVSLSLWESIGAWLSVYISPASFPYMEVDQHIGAWTKWATFCRHLQMHFFFYQNV